MHLDIQHRLLMHARVHQHNKDMMKDATQAYSVCKQFIYLKIADILLSRMNWRNAHNIQLF